EAKGQQARPSLIVVRTTIGYGSPNKQGTSEAHGSPLGAEEVLLAKQTLGWDAREPFTVPKEALEHFREARTAGAERRERWHAALESYTQAHPDLGAEFRRRVQGELPPDFAARCAAELPSWEPGTGLATRESGGKALNALANIVPELVGGDADLSTS